jgi:tRNA (guanine10-N2)-dimethyltransferase
MQHIFILAGDNLPLAAAEVKSIAGIIHQDSRIIISRCSKKTAARLAYVRSAYRLLFSCAQSRVIEKIGKFGWNRLYKNDFSVRKVTLDNNAYPSSNELAHMVGSRLNHPKVNLESSSTPITFIFFNSMAYCGISENRQTDFSARKPHRRPLHMPISMDPKLARLMVNLTGMMQGTIVDPFCGTGGILLEAGLMGFAVKGSDIDRRMVVMSRKNLQHYGITKCSIVQKDALSIRKVSFLATDLPYGKNTKKQDFHSLYLSFITVLEKRLQKKAVIGFPGFFDCRSLVKRTHLRIEDEFTHYIHKSMSKKIVVLSRRPSV